MLLKIINDEILLDIKFVCVRFFLLLYFNKYNLNLLIMENVMYEAPLVEIIEVEVEKGFASSGKPDTWVGQEQL